MNLSYQKNEAEISLDSFMLQGYLMKHANQLARPVSLRLKR